jgi:hypothetical protein
MTHPRFISATRRLFLSLLDTQRSTAGALCWRGSNLAVLENRPRGLVENAYSV